MKVCCVKGCYNSGRKIIQWKEEYCPIHKCNNGTSRCVCDPPFILHPFPTELKHPYDRKIWIKNVNRADDRNKIWAPNKASRICSEHFVDGHSTELNPYPTLKLGHETSTTVTKSRLPPLDRSHIVSTPSKRRKHEEPNSSASENQSDIEILNTSVSEHTVDTAVDNDAADDSFNEHNYSSACIPCHDKETTIENLKKQIKTLQSRLHIYKQMAQTNKKCENVFKSDKSVRFYTGIPSVAAFNNLLRIVEPKVQLLRIWKGPKHFNANILSQKKVLKRGPKKRLSVKEEMTLVLMKLKLGLLNEDLADRFGISSSYVSKIFTTWIKVVSQVLGSLVFNPAKDIVRQNLPPTFRNATYNNVRHIIDCSEVFIETPQNLEMQTQTWSDYKHHNTAKFLISITPSGLINFVSKCWGGRASDKFITSSSGFYDIIEPYDTVMADRGFQIRDELTMLQAHLLVPPGRRGACQMSESEVTKTKTIANRRIYIEQAIRRLKYFRILKYELPITLVQHLDDIIESCAGICNLYPPLPKY